MSSQRQANWIGTISLGWLAGWLSGCLYTRGQKAKYTHTWHLAWNPAQPGLQGPRRSSCNSRRRIVPSLEVGRFAIRNRGGTFSIAETKLGVLFCSRGRPGLDWPGSIALFCCQPPVQIPACPRIRVADGRRRGTRKRARSDPPETRRATRPRGGPCTRCRTTCLAAEHLSCAPLRRCDNP